MDVKSYLSPKTKVKKSMVEGRGLFAIRPIKKGEVVGIKGGHIIDWQSYEKHKKLIGDSYLQIDDNFILAPLTRAELPKVMMFLNHSCEPNVGVRDEITFVAMKDIKAGEELTIDYAMIDADRYTMQCNCGQKSCRKIVTGKDWQNRELHAKYEGYFARYIQDKFARKL